MDVDAIFQQINLRYEWAIWVSEILTLNRLDVDMIFFFHLITALPFPLQNLVQRLRSQTPSSVSSTPNEVSAMPCELFGNTLRALFWKNREFSWYCEIFLPNTRGPLGCLLAFWPSRPKPCGAIIASIWGLLRSITFANFVNAKCLSSIRNFFNLLVLGLYYLAFDWDRESCLLVHPYC